MFRRCWCRQEALRTCHIIATITQNVYRATDNFQLTFIHKQGTLLDVAGNRLASTSYIIRNTSYYVHYKRLQQSARFIMRTVVLPTTAYHMCIIFTFFNSCNQVGYNRIVNLDQCVEVDVTLYVSYSRILFGCLPTTNYSFNIYKRDRTAQHLD